MKAPTDTTSLWQGIIIGGPIIMALHLCMAVCFAVSIVLAFRRTGTVAAFAFAVSPFIFGALGMWFGILGHIAIFPSFSSGLYDGDPVSGLRILQRPFFIGAGLSSAALIVYFLARALLPNARNV